MILDSLISRNPHLDKPHNPMINAGAILTCSLLQALIKSDMTSAEKFDYTMQWFRVFFLYL